MVSECARSTNPRRSVTASECRYGRSVERVTGSGTVLSLPPVTSDGRAVAARVPSGRHAVVTGGDQDRMNSSRSALIVSACVVGIPCGKPA